MLFLLASLLGVALANFSTPPLASPFQAGTEYRFNYEFKQTIGLPLETTDASWFRIMGDVIVQMSDDRQAVLRLQNVRRWLVLKDENGKINQFEEKISHESTKLLELPVGFQYRNGLFSNLQFVDNEEEPWSANIKRAALSMLQMNLNREVEDELRNDKDTFVASEKTVEGDCSLSYTVVDSEDETFVTKTVDFEKCTNQKILRYNVRYMTLCYECVEDTKPVQPKTVYNYRIADHELKEVKVLSTYTIFLKDQSAMKAEIHGQLQMVNSAPITTQLSVPTGDKQDLIYSSRWEEQIENFYKNGDDVLHSVQKNEWVHKIKWSLDEFATFTEFDPFQIDSLRRSTYGELRDLRKLVYEKASLQQQQTIEFALAAAGTKNAIEHLVSLIFEEKMPPLRMTLLLKSIQETPYPSVQIADMILAFADSNISQREPIVRQAAWLASGSIIRGIVGPSMERHLVNESTNEIKKKYVRMLRRNFDESETVYDKIVALKVFANAAIDTSITELEKIIVNRNHHTSVRMEAIDAIRTIQQQMPRKVQRLLLPIFFDRTEKPEIRMSSLVRIVYTDPPMPILAQLIDVMEREPNQEVAAFTYTLFKTAAKTTMPCYQNVAQFMNILLRQTHYRPSDRASSFFETISMYSKKWLSGASFNIGFIFGKSYLPKEISIAVESVILGDWNDYIVQIGMSQQNAEALISKVLKKLSQTKSKSVVRGQRIHAVKSTLQEICRTLNIRTREPVVEEAHAAIYFRYKQMDYFVLPINEHIIDDILDKLIGDESLSFKSWENIWSVNMTMLANVFDTQFQIPTVSGLPLKITNKMPTRFSLEGNVALESLSMGGRLKIRGQPTLQSSHIYQMSVSSPLLEQRATLVKSFEANIPIDVELSMEVNDKLRLISRMKMPEIAKTIVSVESQPVLFAKFPDVDKFVYEHRLYLVGERQIDATRQIAGLDFILQGANYDKWNFNSVLFGKQHLSISVSPTPDTLETISSSVDIDYNSDVSINPPNIKKMMDEWLGEDNEVGIRNFDDRDLSRDNFQGQSLGINMLLESSEKMNVNFRVECQKELRFCRARFNGWDMKLVAEYVLSEMPTSLKQLSYTPHIQAYLQSQWGENTVQLKLRLDQSKEQKTQYEKYAESQWTGAQEYKMLQSFSTPDELKLVANYDLSEENQLLFDRVLSLLRSHNWWKTTVIPRDGTNGQLLMKLNASTVNPRLINAIIHSPHESTILKDLELPIDVLSSMTRLPAFYKMVFGRGKCHMEKTKITTFDDVTYTAPLTSCWSVIAMDCSREPQFAVWAKTETKDANEKVLLVIKGDYEFEIRLYGGKLQVTRDNTPMEELRRHGIRMHNKRYCEINIGEAVVHFDGYTIDIDVCNEYQGKMWGLCGHFDNQKDNDFRSADDHEDEDISSFHRSYTVNDSICDQHTPSEVQKHRYKLYDDTFESKEKYDDDHDNNAKGQKRRSESESLSDPVMINKVLEFSHKICVSTKPIATCQKGENIIESEDKKVKFTCLPRYDPHTREFLTQLRREPKEIENRKVSLIELIRVPTTCSA